MPATVLLTAGSAVTIGSGVWHLFVPVIWSWCSYFPREASELVVTVRAISLFFSISLVVFGVLMLLFIYRKPMVVFYARSIPNLTRFALRHPGCRATHLSARQRVSYPAIRNASRVHCAVRVRIVSDSRIVKEGGIGTGCALRMPASPSERPIAGRNTARSSATLLVGSRSARRPGMPRSARRSPAVARPLSSRRRSRCRSGRASG